MGRLSLTTQAYAGEINRAVFNASSLLAVWLKQSETPPTSPLWEIYADWTRKTENAFLTYWAEMSRDMNRRLIELETKAAKDLLMDTAYWSDISDGYAQMSTGLMEEAAQVGYDVAAASLQKTYGLGVFDDQGKVTQWANRYTVKLAKGLTKTDRSNLQTQIAAWTQAKEGLPELTARVNKIINNPVRARTIAQTESTRAYARGNIKAWEDSEVVTGKVWRTAEDERVCPICGRLADQLTTLTATTGGTARWRDIKDPTRNAGGIADDPPAHVNCRCWLAPWVDEVPRYVPPARPGQVVRPPKPKAPKPPKAFPKDIKGLKKVKDLGGSTGAQLVEDPKTGLQYVMKRGASADHLRSEALADSIYRRMRIPVPEFQLYETGTGPVKLAKFIEGDTLAVKLRTASVKELDAIYAKLQKGFGTDSLLGNWDVIGLEADNIIIDAKGIPWRIDNGGALQFRAMGRPKGPAGWNEWVDELWTLRDPARNKSAAAVFGDMDYWDVLEQVDDLTSRKNRRAILSLIDDDDLRKEMLARLDLLDDVAHIGHTFYSDNFTAAYTDGFTKHSVGVRQYGITDAFPKRIRANQDHELFDQDGLKWDHLRGRESVVKDLETYMKNNGGDHEVIQRWAHEQAGNSWNPAPRAVKYYMVEARGGNYPDHYWGSEGLDWAKKSYNQAIAAIGQEKWDNSYQAWHAFNYEYVRSVPFENNYIKEGFIGLGRTESSEVLLRRGISTGDVNALMNRGPLESSSAFSSVSIGGDNLTLQKVPHQRVFGGYWFERTPGSEDCLLYGNHENEVVFLTDKIPFGVVGKSQSNTRFKPLWKEWYDKLD
jgi:hypothetical protein